MGNLIVVLILAAAVFLAVRVLRRDGGKCSCGCEGCTGKGPDCAHEDRS